jgi:septum formation protein
MTDYPALYLASRSPRRQELLRQLGVSFEPLRLREASGRQRDIVEVAHDGEPALHYIERIARTKATVGGQHMLRRGLPPRPVLGADTEVVLDGLIYGKPRDTADAARMLTLLSGRTHHVSTAIAVNWEGEITVEIATTAVSFRELTREEIDRYVATGESVDKAGAYAIQGRAAGFASRLEGSYSGVMGLPLFETARVLARIGVRVL